MTDTIKLLRTSTAGNRPAGHLYGEPYVNFPDLQFGAVDSTGTAQDLLAVRRFSTLASYNIGDFVTQGGIMYRGIAASTPGAFVSANWAAVQTASATGNYIPITGGATTTFVIGSSVNGALTATAGGTLAAATYYVRSTWVGPMGVETLAMPETSLAVAVNNVLNVASPTVPPAQATGWNVYVSTATGTETKQNGSTPIAIGSSWVEPTSGLVAGAALPTQNTTGFLTVNGQLYVKGQYAGLACYDEGQPGGNTANAFWFYRTNNIGRLNMIEAGDVLQIATSGISTFLFPVYINGTATTYPLFLTSPASQHCLLSYSVTSVRSWSVGVETDGAFHWYDAGYGDRMNLTTSGVLNLNSSTGDPVNIVSPNNTYCRTRYTVSGTRTWSDGVRSDGAFAISDESAGVARVVIGTTGVMSLACYDYYAIQISNNSGQSTAIYHVPSGQHAWMDGPMSNVAANNFVIYDNTSGGTRFMLSSSQTFCYGNTYASYGGGLFICGQSGYWEGNSQANFSLYTGIGAVAVYGGASSGGWALYARTDAWTTYNMLIVQDSAAVGSITSNGSNAFFNTTCDARSKDNIRPLHSEIDVGGIIDALKPVAFEWKPLEFKTLGEPAFENRDADGNDIGRPAVEGKLVRIEAITDHGFVAQDLYEVLPGIVHKPEKEELPMMADYSKIVPYVIAELQALRRRVAELEAQLKPRKRAA